MSEVSDHEEIARLLFYPQMVRNGELEPSAFPMDELLAKNGKNGSSVDRCDLLKDKVAILKQKSKEISNPAAQRSPYGFCTARAEQIRAIPEEKNSKQALDVFPDEIRDNDPPKPWDHAHALLRKHNNEYTRANLRGTRDHLTKIFSKNLTEF